MLKQETLQRVLRFRDDRNWRQFHTPKDLALTLNLEAAELLEVFQWSGADLECTEKREQLKAELADVVTCCILMADACGLDLDAIITEKMTRNETKYPVEKAWGNAAKYTELK